MLTNAHAVRLSARLDGSDWEDVYDAAIEVAVKSELSDAVVFTMAKAAYVATVLTPGKSMRSYHADTVKAGSKKSRPTLINYKDSWAMALLTEPTGTEPTPDRVTGANTIVGNSKAANRARFVSHLECEVDMGLRREIFDYYVANYADVDKDFGPLVEESEEVEGDESEGETEGGQATDNGFDGMLSVLQGLAGRIQRGEFTVAEAVQFAQAAKGILVAAEVLASETVAAPVAA